VLESWPFKQNSQVIVVVVHHQLASYECL